MRYLLDTSVINKLIDGTIMPSELPRDGFLVASNIQLSEIGRTSDPERRSQLLAMLSDIVDEMTVIGSDPLEDGSSAESLKRELDARNGGRASNRNDALLAQFALRSGSVLLTADLDLYEVAYISGVGLMYWTTPNKRFESTRSKQGAPQA